MIASLVVIRILVQFLAQIVGVIVLRVRRPDLHAPVSHVALSAARADRAERVHLRAHFTQELSRERYGYAAVLAVVGLNDLLHSCTYAG